jgi:hypothetical protein
MVLRTRIEVFTTPGIYPSMHLFVDEMMKELDGWVATRLVTRLEGYASGWKTPPRFETRPKLLKDGFFIEVWATGPGAINWNRVSRGVKGRWIQVKKATTYRGYKKYRPALKLQRYAPRTAPGGGAWGGSGRRLLPVAYRRRVWWPGIKPRHFEPHAQRALESEFKSRMRTAIRRAAKVARSRRAFR